jgi:hypothetical protein
MKRVLGLLLGLFGIFAAAAPLTSERNPNSYVRSSNRLIGAVEGDAASVCIVSPARTQKRLRMVATVQPSPVRPINRRLSGAKGPQPLWLSELNQWRRLAGLRLVAENAYLNHGSEEHARYLVAEGPAEAAAFRAYDRRIGAGAHLEDRNRPSYTTTGAEAAIGGPLAADVIQGADVAWEGRTESGDIDNLVVAPFHRLSLLAPWAQVGGYGSFGEYPKRAAALALRGPLSAQQRRKPIEFPPANTTISIVALSGSEWPNPIGSCPGYERPVGLPITLQTGSPLVLQFFSIRDQTSGHELETCGFDALGYRNSNALQRKRGRELLNAYGAVVLIPRNPLLFGHQYRVTTQTSQGRLAWAFRVEEAADVGLPQAPRTAIRQVAATR